MTGYWNRTLCSISRSDKHPCRRLAVPVAVGLALLVSHPATAFKWSSCPTLPLPLYPSTLGATNAPFIHPGHALTIVLNQDETASTGGFSLTSDGNSIAISFRSLFGAAIDLDPLEATATTSSVLTFDFPDTSDGGAAVLAGPVDILVTVNGGVVAHIAASDFVALPNATDVTSAVLGADPDLTVLGALAADGDIWVPAAFQGTPMEMPGCPGDFIVPAPILLGGATVDGLTPANPNPLDHIRGVVSYLGDMEISGSSFYGMLNPHPISLVQVNGTLGVAICRMNDAVDVVLRVQGDRSWALPQSSPFRLVASGSRAIPLHLNAPSLRPGKQGPPAVVSDSLGNPCVPGKR